MISGLCGIRASEGDSLVINPLLDASLSYYCLQDLRYHGHKLTVVYDKDGERYKLGKGLTVMVDGKKVDPIQQNGRWKVFIGRPVENQSAKSSRNFALNIEYKGYPSPSASVNTLPDSLYKAIDGRIWYFREISNRWTTLGSQSTTDWYGIDFGKGEDISNVRVSLYTDGEKFGLPENIQLEYKKGSDWVPVKTINQIPSALTANTTNIFTIEKINTKELRVKFMHENSQVALTELQCY